MAAGETLAFNNPWQTSKDGDATGQRVDLLSFDNGSFFHQILSDLSLPSSVLRTHVTTESCNILGVDSTHAPPKKRSRADACHPPAVPAGYQGFLETAILLRNSASMGVFAENLPDESKQLVRDELQKRGLSSEHFPQDGCLSPPRGRCFLSSPSGQTLSPFE